MTEEEWWAGGDLQKMLSHLATGPTDRKWRLFAYSGTCLAVDCLPAVAVTALSVVERHAEGLASEQEVADAHAAVVQLIPEPPSESPVSVIAWSLHKQIGGSYPLYYVMPFVVARFLEPRLPSKLVLPALIRCIFGNPFRPVAFDPRWRSADAVGVARGIYEDRAFDRLPLLADALMDAGCDDEQVIGHCRSDGPHVRGCWVVDMVLGKE